MAKRIILLADGTGNALRAQVSNIARIMDALVISQEQVVCYIPGVGTESFFPFAWLDSATGLGVPANVRKLYWFLSWHWEPGCEIYMFGFSRGAFTIRLLVSFIASEGLLSRFDGMEMEIDKAILAAWRSYKSKLPDKTTNIWVRLGLGKLADGVATFQRFVERVLGNAEPKRFVAKSRISIAFVGLFDTVDALGVPIEEMREGVHRLVWPIRFGNDDSIWKNVRCVRHALSLDDERRTFHPIRVSLLPGDEESGRVKEIWFAGVHSDVGGGYPDDMTAHVPLVWMMEEAFKAVEDDPARRLILQTGALEKFCNTATYFGPLHNSRSGIRRVYRYAHRTVKPYDALGNPYPIPVVHHSVVERLVDRNYDYVPLLISKRFEVCMPDGSVAKQATGPGYKPVTSVSETSVPTSMRVGLSERFEKAEAALNSLDYPEPEEMEFARNYVWLKGMVYSLFFGLFILVLLLPFTDGLIDWLSSYNFLTLEFVPGVQSILDALANVFRGFGDAMLSLTPAWLSAHVQAASRHPLFITALILSYFTFRRLGFKYQYAMRQHVLRAWRVPSDERYAPGPLLHLMFRLRNSPARHALITATRPFLPTVYTFAFIVMPALILINRAGFNYLVGSGSVCRATDRWQWVGLNPVERSFSTNDPCWASGWRLERGASYRLTINISPENGDAPWLDYAMMTDPYGFEYADFYNWVLGILRRWPSVAWFHPIARIGARGEVEWPLVPVDGGTALDMHGRRCTRLPIPYDATAEHKVFCASTPGADSCRPGMGMSVSDPLPCEELDGATRAWVGPNEYGAEKCISAFPRRNFVSEFIARDTGELFLFVNDSVHISWPGRAQVFYRNNTGTATITLVRTEVGKPSKSSFRMLE